MKPSHQPGAFGSGFRQAVFRRKGPRRPRRPLPRLRGLPLQKLIPNAMTVLALCAGMTSVRFALQERWEAGVAAILIAAVIDGLDGRVARLLQAQSRFGEELDSLADAVNFGVCPALLLYLWSLQHAGGVGWFAALALAVCCVLRLARFNAGLGATDKPPWAFNYFTGVPAPAGAGLALAPMALSFAAGGPNGAPPAAPLSYLVGIWTIVVAGLMVSAVPTFSFKRLRVPLWLVVPLLLGVGLVAAALVTQPWWTLFFLAVAYVGTMAVSARQFARLKEAAEALQGAETPPAESADAVAAAESLPPPASAG